MKRLIIATTGASLLFATGCVESPEMTDAEWINEVVASSNLTSTADLDGSGDPSESGKSDEEVSLPEFWHRQLVNATAAEIILENDPAAGICTVTVIHNLTAELILDTVWDGFYEPGSKSINAVRFTRLVVERMENVSSHGGWEIVSATAAEHMLSSGTQEVFISSMSIYKNDELIWYCNDPGTFYQVDSELPQLLEGDFVRLEATVEHLSPQYDPPFFVIAHGPLSGHSRHLMYDNGLYGDKVAEDGVYSYEWYVEYTGKHQRIAVDAIDADTFADQIEQDYDSAAWGIHFLK